MPMIYPQMWVPLFSDATEKEREFSLFALRELLEALVRINVGWITTHRSEFVPLYKCGVRYAPEEGTEDWLSIPEIYRAVRSGKPVDCEDLAGALAAERRLFGAPPALKPCHAIADVRGRVVGGQVRMHAFVRYPDQSVEDPSIKLGMPGQGAEGWEREYPAEMVKRVQRLQRRLKAAA